MEEKERFRWEETSIGSPWNRIGSDIDVVSGIRDDASIQPFLTLVNLLPYAYTPGMSCSGATKDHYGVQAVRRNERFGINVSQPQGYCVIRAHTKHEKWHRLEELLLSLPGTALTPAYDWERTDMREEELFPNTDERTLFCYQLFLQENNKYHPGNAHKAWEHLSRGVLRIITSINPYENRYEY